MLSSVANGVGVLDRIEYQINTSFLRFIRFLIFPIGVSCMVVAGYFLIQGFLQIGGDNSAKNMWIVLGILFQIGESACFVSAAAFTNHSLLWRYSALGFGILLFMMSIGVMTLAQKTAMFTGETQAIAVDQQRHHIKSQIDSLEELIASYRLNAEKQSQSIYAQSRALGQESLNKAAELEEKKLALSNELFALTSSRKQTSMDFFSNVEEMFGYDAQKTEFAFYVARSLFVEGLGIFLMALGAYHFGRNSKIYASDYGPPPGDQTYANNAFHSSAAAYPESVNRLSVSTSPEDNDPTGLPLPSEDDVFIEPEPMDEETKAMVDKLETALSKPNQYWANDKVRQLRELRIETNGIDEQQEIEQLTSVVHRLHREGDISSVGRDTVRKAVKEHCGTNIGSRKAMEISKLVKKRISETP